VHGNLDDDARDGALARFARGELSVLVNVMVLTEGWDCPRAKVCILARRIGSASLYLQMVGRVLRPYPGVERAMLIDLAGNWELHGYPDEERVWSLTGTACTRRSQSNDGIRFCRVCQTEIPPGLLICPCGTPLPEQKTPRGEGVELEKILEREARQEERARLPPDKRVGMLASLYAKGIRKGHKKRAAELAYRSMTGRYPDTALMVRAWQLANEKVAEERGDAYVPPIVEEETYADVDG